MKVLLTYMSNRTMVILSKVHKIISIIHYPICRKCEFYKLQSYKIIRYNPCQNLRS